MNQHSQEVAEAIESASAVAHRLAKLQRPNEDITEIDYEKFVKIIADTPEKLVRAEESDLISIINTIVEELTFPTIDQATSSRGLLITQVHGYELVRSLENIKNKARIARYTDPEIPNLDLTTPVSELHMRKINDQLGELSKQIEKLDEQLKSDRQIGITFGVGPLSGDIGVLIGMVRDSTENAQAYISDQYAINAQTLQNKFAVVHSSANSLLGIIAERADLFGKAVVRLTRKVARSATDVYRNGLKLIKYSYDNAKSKQHASGSETHRKPVSDKQLVSDLGRGRTNYAQALVRVTESVLNEIERRSKQNYLARHDIDSFELFQSHEIPHLTVRLSEQNLKFTYQLSRLESEILSHYDENEVVLRMRQIRENLFGVILE